MTTLVVFGADGLLGRALAEVALPAGWRRRLVGRRQADIRNGGQVLSALAGLSRAVVVNAAAYTAVDKAESEPGLAFAVNRDGVAHLAGHLAVLGIPLIHMSTDYVFDGQRKSPYAEDAEPAPLSVYGNSKLAGERAVLRAAQTNAVVRTSRVFGRHGRCFPRLVLELGRQCHTLSMVDDQIACPTPADDLARALVRMAAHMIAPQDAGRISGLYHYCGEGPVSWHDFAAALSTRAEQHGIRLSPLRAIPSRDYPQPARRPSWSALACDRLRRDCGILPPDWRQGLSEYLPGWLDV